MTIAYLAELHSVDESKVLGWQEWALRVSRMG